MTRPAYVRQSRGDVDLSDKVPWLNVSGEEVPAFGVIQLRTNYASGLSQASKPNSTSGIFFANGPVSAGVGAKGESQLWNRPRRVAVNETLTVGDQVGPEADSWYMTTAGNGFWVIHQDDTGIATVMPIGGSGGGITIWFTVYDADCYDPDNPVLTVQPYRNNIGCNASIPGADGYGRVEVHDDCNYLDGLVMQELIDGQSRGRATYMYPMTGYCEPKWILDDICHQPQC